MLFKIVLISFFFKSGSVLRIEDLILKFFLHISLEINHHSILILKCTRNIYFKLVGVFNWAEEPSQPFKIHISSVL